MPFDYDKLIYGYQKLLDSEATQKTQQWWERYLKGVIRFRGVGIPKNRELLTTWRERHGIDTWPLENQLELALRFFSQPVAEDKLAGILFIQNFLYDKLPWRTLLRRYSEVYEKGWIFDWNTCDWFCVRVLGPTIEEVGDECARAVASWSRAANLWQARSSVVSFVNLAAEEAYRPYIEEACAVLLGRDERFAKTAVGWILREISKHDGAFVISFVDRHLNLFSKESLGNALKYFDGQRKQACLQEFALLKRSQSP